MTTINIPDFHHFARLKTISAYEAVEILASIELSGKNISDPDEYERLLKDEMSKVGRVLTSAIGENTQNPLNHICDEEAIRDVEGKRGYVLSRITVNMKDFCSWASDQNYNLPDILVKLSKDTDNNIIVKKQDAECGNGASEPKPKKEVKDGGRPEGTLAEAVRHAYKTLQCNQNEKWRLKKDNIRDFIEFLKFMNTANNPHEDKYVMERIESVKIPHIGDCTIKTHERRDLIAKGKSRGLARTYHNSHVTRILMRLRKELPLPE